MIKKSFYPRRFNVKSATYKASGSGCNHITIRSGFYRRASSYWYDGRMVLIKKF